MDVRRFRPLVAVVLTVIAMIPSFTQMLTEDLSAVSVLARLALSFFLIGCLVWLVTAVILHYVGIQAGRENPTLDHGETV